MRVKDKIKEIEKYLDEFAGIMPDNFEEYKEAKTKAACERYFEKIVEAAVDLSFLIIKDRGLKIPEGDKEVFDVLFGDNIITLELAEKFKDAKGMRNIIAHEYGAIDDKIVFNSITNELIKDSEEFIKRIKLVYMLK